MEKDGEYLRVDNQPRDWQWKVIDDLLNTRKVNRSQRRSDGGLFWEQSINKIKA